MDRLIEAMEQRVLMATNAGEVSFVDGVLIVEGTDGNDRILVDFPAGPFIEGPLLRVTVNGQTTSFEHPRRPGRPDLAQINIRGGAGNDRMLVGSVGIGARIEGGEGND